VRPSQLLPWLLLAACLAGCGAAVPAAPGPPVAANPDVRVFVEPDDGPEPLLAEINGARKSIDLVMYLFSDRQVISALENAERRGVQTRVLLEQHPFGEGQGNAETFNRLERAGVAARWTSPRFKLTHEKAAVIDGREALILTLNLTASAFSRNREYGAIDTTSDDVAEVGALFNADWNRTVYAPARPGLVVSPDNSRARLVALIGQASRQLDLESEEVQDEGLEQAIVAAARRGVSVRLVLSPAEAGVDNNAKGVQRLKAGGVQVRYMKKPYVHAKMVIADGLTAFLGSENISAQSLDANRELGLFVAGSAVTRLQTTFEQDWGSRT
jgi:cardiolipin synthase